MIAPAATAARLLWLAPDWDEPLSWVPVLSSYVRRAPATSGLRLCVDATNTDLPQEIVTQLVTAVCDAAAGDASFAEVVLITDDDRREEAAASIASVGELERMIELEPLTPSSEPQVVVAQAQRAKLLCDALRLAVWRWRFDHSPDPWQEPLPLVTVRIPTWGRHDALVNRTIPSVLGGSYPNVEVIVTSDGPDPAARAAVEAIGDPRVRYLDLPSRPSYPSHPESFWQSAGCHAVNAALDARRGSFTAPLDHDDAFTEDHIVRLMAAMRQRGADVVWGHWIEELVTGPWAVRGSAQLEHGHINHGGVMYSPRLRHCRLDPHCWLLGDPADWTMWRSLREIGARFAFLQEIVLVYSRGRTAIAERVGPGHQTTPVPRSVDDLAADVLGTDARVLLDVRLADRP